MKFSGRVRFLAPLAAAAVAFAIAGCSGDRATGVASTVSQTPVLTGNNGFGNPHLDTDVSGCTWDLEATEDGIACTVQVAGLGDGGVPGGTPGWNQDAGCTAYCAEGIMGIKAIVEADWVCTHFVDNGHVSFEQTHEHKRKVYGPGNHISDLEIHNGSVTFYFTDDLNVAGNVGDCPGPDNPPAGPSHWELTGDVTSRGGWRLAACVGNVDIGLWYRLEDQFGGALVDENGDPVDLPGYWNSIENGHINLGPNCSEST